MYLYDEIVIMDMCPTKRYNINSDDHERRGQKTYIDKSKIDYEINLLRYLMINLLERCVSHTYWHVQHLHLLVVVQHWWKQQRGEKWLGMQFPTAAAAAKKGSTFSYSLPTGRLAIVTEQHIRLFLSLLLIPAPIFHLYYLDIFLQLGTTKFQNCEKIYYLVLQPNLDKQRQTTQTGAVSSSK